MWVQMWHFLFDIIYLLAFVFSAVYWGKAVLNMIPKNFHANANNKQHMPFNSGTCLSA